MKTLKAFYYRMKQKNACSYFEYWHTKALANMKDIDKCLVCFDHMIYWLGKIFDYNAAARKELES